MTERDELRELCDGHYAEPFELQCGTVRELLDTIDDLERQLAEAEQETEIFRSLAPEPSPQDETGNWQ